MSRFAPIGAGLLACLAAWVSQGTIGFGAPDGARLAILPLSTAGVLVSVGAGAAVLGLWRAGASLSPVPLLVFVLLPWLPVPVPAAFLLWVKGLAWLTWIGVFALMIASLGIRPPLPRTNPRVLAAAVAAVLFGLSAWRVAPMIPGGDEPHYLVITQSLLLDGDLTIEDVHRRGDYRAYYPGDLAPHVQRRGLDGRVYSVHAPGLPVVVAPAFAIGGYRAVVVLLVLIAAAGSALAWHVAWLATGREDAAWFGWATVTLPVTAIFQSFTIYPDGAGGVLALTGLWALLRAEEESRTGAASARPWFLHGVALALLPWFHSRFAILAGGFGALILLRLSSTKNPAAKAVAFLSVPAVSAILWVGFFIAIYGTADPSAPYAAGEMGSFAFVPGGLGGLLFDQRFGLIAYAPVMVFAFAGLALMAAGVAARRLGLEMLFVVLPYLVTVTHFAMWWGGWSPPARFFAPILPLFAVPAAIAFILTRRRTTRVLAAVALGATAVASTVVIWVDRGRLAFNTREARALWLEWLGRLTDLTSAAPLWARDTDMPLFRAIAVWTVVMAATWALLRTADASRRLRDLPPLRAVVAAALGVAVMLASTVVWTFEGTSGRADTAPQLALLESLAAQPKVVAVRLDGPSRISPGTLPGMVRVELSRSPSNRPIGRETPPMFALPALPAGDYRLTVTGAAARGLVMVGIARDQFALSTVQLPAPAIELRFPLPVRGLLVRGDEEARRVIDRLVLEPLRVLKPSERVTDDVARRAVRYGGSTVLFLDDRAFPEPEAFWVGGSRDARVVLQPDAPRQAVTLRLRNAPVANQVTLESGQWRQDLQLAPGEEQQIEVPIEPSRGAGLLRIVSASGFRPSEHDPASRDHRFLGVWVKPLP